MLSRWCSVCVLEFMCCLWGLIEIGSDSTIHVKKISHKPNTVSSAFLFPSSAIKELFSTFLCRCQNWGVSLWKVGQKGTIQNYQWRAAGSIYARCSKGIWSWNSIWWVCSHLETSFMGSKRLRDYDLHPVLTSDLYLDQEKHQGNIRQNHLTPPLPANWSRVSEIYSQVCQLYLTNLYDEDISRYW